MAAAVLALFTAYVRLLGGALGVTQHFIGPMAKQHRMFTLTVFTLLAGVEAFGGTPPHAMRIGLSVIVAGSIVTAFRRTSRIAAELEAR
jgi:drug/metabolite transporter (DMT)-like permease